jgi:hypothetical protein
MAGLEGPFAAVGGWGAPGLRVRQVDAHAVVRHAGLQGALGHGHDLVFGRSVHSGFLLFVGEKTRFILAIEIYCKNSLALGSDSGDSGIVTPH